MFVNGLDCDCILNHLVFVQPARRVTTTTPCLDDYEPLRTLGAGANATVYLVREKHTSHLYALKVVDKFVANGQKVLTSMVINEQSALAELNGNDFVLPLHTCFHDSENFYLVTVSAPVFWLHFACPRYQQDYLPGGDLERLQSFKELDVEAIRFYMAELVRLSRFSRLVFI